MAFMIRKFDLADREFILGLVPRFSEFEMPPGRERTEIDHTNFTALVNAMEQPEACDEILLTVDGDGSRAGFIHLQTQADAFTGEPFGYLSDLAVHPDFEGRGVAGMLMEAAEGWARQNGLRRLALYVFAGNHHARRLYERKGYQPEVVKYVKLIG